MKKCKLLITGVGGFIGSRVAEKCVAHGFQVVGVDDFSQGFLSNVPDGVELIKGDLSEVDLYRKIPTDCTHILHLAGQSSGEISFDNPLDDLRKNTSTTIRLVEFANANNVRQFILASSMSVYGDVADKPIDVGVCTKPLSCYGVGKLAAESYLKILARSCSYVVFRMFNVYGPGQDLDNLRQGMVSIYLSQAVRSGEILVKGSVNRFRDFIHIDDVAQAWFGAIDNDAVMGRTINLGTGRRTTVRELLELICSEKPGSSYRVEGATPGDQSGIFAAVDMELLAELGLSGFIPLQVGIKDFVKWAEKQSV